MNRIIRVREVRLIRKPIGIVFEANWFMYGDVIAELDDNKKLTGKEFVVMDEDKFSESNYPSSFEEVKSIYKLQSTKDNWQELQPGDMFVIKLSMFLEPNQ
jgi:hypothetical protein